jgi:hypothetical protein
MIFSFPIDKHILTFEDMIGVIEILDAILLTHHLVYNRNGSSEKRKSHSCSLSIIKSTDNKYNEIPSKQAFSMEKENWKRKTHRRIV